MPIGREVPIVNHRYGSHHFEGNTQLNQMVSCSYSNSSHFRVCIFFWKYPIEANGILFIFQFKSFQGLHLFWEIPKLKQIYIVYNFNLPVYGLHVFGGLTQLRITPNPLMFLLVVSLYCCCHLGDFCKNTCSRQH